MPRKPSKKVTKTPSRKLIPRHARTEADKKRKEVLAMSKLPIRKLAGTGKSKKNKAGGKKKTTSRSRKTSSTRKTAKKSKHKPTYLKMIIKAIRDQTDGMPGFPVVSKIKIGQYIVSHYPVSDSYKRYMNTALDNGEMDGVLVRRRNSYRVSAKHLPKKKKKKTTRRRIKEKKKTTTRTTRKRKMTASSKKKSTRGRKKRKSTVEAASDVEVSSADDSSYSSDSSDEDEESMDGDELVWVWQFKENDGGFYNYDTTASADVEAMYQMYKSNPAATDVQDVKSGDWTYRIDFRQMHQMNMQHDNHTVRDVRRIQLPRAEFVYPSKRYD